VRGPVVIRRIYYWVDILGMTKIKIKTKNFEVEASLNQTKAAQAIYQILPIKAEAKLWGEEIYFPISVKLSKKDLEDPKKVVEVGDIGYWPPGPGFCIFFGKTPVSTETEIRPASAVEVIGKFGKEAISLFKKVQEGEEIIIYPK